MSLTDIFSIFFRFLFEKMSLVAYSISLFGATYCMIFDATFDFYIFCVIDIMCFMFFVSH